MAQRILEIIGTACRGTLEEQHEPITWLAHPLRGNGTAVAVLLRGKPAPDLVRGQDASGLAFGTRRQMQPPGLDADVGALVDNGVAVSYVEEEVAARGLQKAELRDAAQPSAQAPLPELLGRYGQVWHFWGRRCVSGSLAAWSAPTRSIAVSRTTPATDSRCTRATPAVVASRRWSH